MQEVLDSYQSLVGYHDLILHKYGPNKMFATVDVEVDARWDLIEAHRVKILLKRNLMNDLVLNWSDT